MIDPLPRIHGVSLLQKAAVNLLAGKAEVQYNPDITGPRFLIHAVQDAGFEAHLLRGDRCAALSILRRHHNRHISWHSWPWAD